MSCWDEPSEVRNATSNESGDLLWNTSGSLSLNVTMTIEKRRKAKKPSDLAEINHFLCLSSAVDKRNIIVLSAQKRSSRSCAIKMMS